ncbi:PASTA domain-containing protein [Curtobacterium sp. ZW137]|uniref:PASTA domain-containing protein n=1 Tax=Curtobacterium sp. ZW137 TaxID=2485104 RepID=UPI000F4CBE9D|nr:PASTA domain-containing protein [Curtobacterium sp. ZW137]ROP60325.1 PASTA domain-containing protein [Curtobacterium sp. ZW137]
MGTFTYTQQPARARGLLRALIAIFVGLSLVLGGATTAHAADKVKTPKVTGQSADDARDKLEDLGFKVKLKAKPKADGPVFLESNWKVSKQSVKAGKKVKEGKKITLTVKKKKKAATSSPTATASPTADPDVTTAGLDSAHALTACDRYGDQQFPYGWKGHVFLGVIADENQGDHYFVKFEADVTNAYNATASGTAECTVGGSNDTPMVTEFNVY